MDAAEARRLFTEEVRRPEGQVNLLEASLLIAQEEYPAMDRLEYIGRVDAMGRSAKDLVESATDPHGRANRLSEHLFDDEAFRGNEAEYYDPRNSYLNQVLDRKLGIPITLSLLYIEVAARAGMSVEGIGMPGHFLVRYAADGEEIIVDPFRRGIILSHADCSELLRRATGRSIPVTAAELPAVSARQLLNRMLNNLKGIYLTRRDYPRALAAVERMLLVDPGQPEELRDRGLIKHRLGMLREAVFDLDTYLNANPDAADADAIERQAGEIRRELLG